MNIWQYAIARRHAQLLETAAERELTWWEVAALEVTSQRVLAYEADEMHVVVKSGGAN
jgi:hypothetical protein